MKNIWAKNILKNLGLLCAVALAAGATPELKAAALYWDASGSATDSTFGGTGTWNTTNTFFNTGAVNGSGTLQAWNNAASPLDSANFLRGTSGTVTVSGTETAIGLNFGVSAGSYTTGSSTYTLSGGTAIDLRAATNATVLSNINSSTTTISTGIILFGAGTNLNQVISNTSGTLTLNTITEGGAGTHTITLSGGASTTTSINGNIARSTGSLRLVIGNTTDSNTAQYVFGGSNTFSFANPSFNRGTLTLNSSGALGGTNSLVMTNANIGTTTGLPDTVQLLIGTAGVTNNKGVSLDNIVSGDTADVRVIGGSNSTGTSTFSGAITLGTFASSGVGASLQLTAATGGTTIFSGTISDGVNTSPITKVGGGTVQLTAAAGNTYDGGTTVSAGTLLVNNTSGSGTGTGAVSVSSTGTLGGSGIIAGATTISNGTLSPGNSPGVLTFNSDLTLSGNSTSSVFEIATGTRGTNFDGVDIGGALTYDGVLTFSMGALIADATYDLFNTTGSLFNSFDSVVFAGGAYSGTFTNSSGIWTSSITNGQIFTFTESTGDLVAFSSVPEPSTYAMFALGGLALWAFRRRCMGSLTA